MIEHLNIDLIGFKKGRFNTFASQLPHTIQHFYQEPLTQDEINDGAQRITRHFLDAIRKKANGGH